jgi:type III pantothenate kinase
MNLVIDQGNTVIKLAIFNAGEIIARIVEPELNLKSLKAVFEKFPEISDGILSSVAHYSPEITEILRLKLNHFIILDHQTPLPIKNCYDTKETLGYDRIADAVGAFACFPGRNILVIDAGTAITIDLVTAAGEFQGGNISPGLDLRFKALHEHTRKLPLIEKKEEFPFLGKNTSDAILAGVLNGACFELDGYIDNLKMEYPDIKIILTGGDAKYFDKKLKNSIFANSNLNLTGLNRILEYNAEKN